MTWTEQDDMELAAWLDNASNAHVTMRYADYEQMQMDQEEADRRIADYAYACSNWCLQAKDEHRVMKYWRGAAVALAVSLATLATYDLVCLP